MFTEPITVTVNAVAKVMPRIEIVSGSKPGAVYGLADGTFKLSISHTPTKDRVRTLARLDQKAIVPDPLTAVNDYETLSVYLVIDRPLAGFTMAQVEQLIAGFNTWMGTATVDKLYGLES